MCVKDTSLKLKNCKRIRSKECLSFLLLLTVFFIHTLFFAKLFNSYSSIYSITLKEKIFFVLLLLTGNMIKNRDKWCNECNIGLIKPIVNEFKRMVSFAITMWFWFSIDLLDFVLFFQSASSKPMQKIHFFKSFLIFQQMIHRERHPQDKNRRNLYLSSMNLFEQKFSLQKPKFDLVYQYNFDEN